MKLIAFDDVRADLVEEADALIQEALNTSHPVEHPRIIHLCGIPGAGKTTYANKWLSTNSTFVCVQFDTTMERLTGYQNDRAQLGLVEAFTRWELPARAIGYHILQALVENQRNVFFDHSATNKMHVDLLRQIKNRGYRVEMHFIDCSSEEAARRVAEREKLIQRHTPIELIYERQELLRQLLPIYKQLVDEFKSVG